MFMGICGLNLLILWHHFQNVADILSFISVIRWLQKSWELLELRTRRTGQNSADCRDWPEKKENIHDWWKLQVHTKFTKDQWVCIDGFTHTTFIFSHFAMLTKLIILLIFSHNVAAHLYSASLSRYFSLRITEVFKCWKVKRLWLLFHGAVKSQPLKRSKISTIETNFTSEQWSSSED